MRMLWARQTGADYLGAGGGLGANQLPFGGIRFSAAVVSVGNESECGCLACAMADIKSAAQSTEAMYALRAPDGEGPQFLGDDIGDNTSSTTTLNVGSSLTSTINHSGDLDYVRVSLVAGQTYTFSMAATPGGVQDAYVELRTTGGALVAENDDGGINLNSFLMFTATTTGDYFVVARGFDGSSTGGYTLGVEAIDTGNTSPTTFPDNGLTQFSWEEAAVQITRSGASWAQTFGTSVVVTYSYRATSAGMPTGPDGVDGFTQFNAAQIAATEAALAAWAAVANITFVNVGGSGYSDEGSIRFGNYSSGAEDAAAFAYLPTSGNTASTSVQGDVWVNSTLNYNANPVVGDPVLGYGPHVLLHEIGHALGLSHPGDYNAGTGNPSYPASVDYYGDTRMFTAMSYFASINTGGNLATYASLPQLHDIAAIQRLYGANLATRTGDTIYGFNSNTGLPEYAIALANEGAVFTVWDGGGNDTLDLSGYSTDSTIDLREESFSSAGPGANVSFPATFNISIARGVTIENAIGGSGSDTIYGNGAANTLNGGTGNDAMRGGLGNDTYVVDALGDNVIEQAAEGVDTVQTTLNNYTLGANVENLTLTGSANLNGSGNALGNTLIGNSGDNTLNGGAGADAMQGGLGNDTYVVDDAGDTVTEAASAGTDLVQSAVTFTLSADIENLTLTGASAINGTGNALANILIGNSGNNILNGAGGGDTMQAGAGDDDYYVDDAGDIVTENPGEGTDRVFASITYTLTANVENLVLTGSANINGTGNVLANSLTGNSGENSLFGEDGADLLDGAGGNDFLYGGADIDTLYGRAGADLLDGGTGADTMFGGDGDDIYYVDNAGDVTTDNGPSGGSDTVVSSVTRTLGAALENLFLTGSADLSGEGNELANGITGNTGANVLNGRAGNDTINAGLGADTLYGGDGDDIMNGQEDADFLDGGNNNDTLSGGDAVDTLYGRAGNDIVDGGAGADTMFGGAGDDSYFVDDSGDVVGESASAGTDTIYASVTRSLGQYQENLSLTGSALINGTGNILANVMVGNNSANTLSGLAGADMLDGNGGNDTLFGGDGNDTLNGAEDDDILDGGNDNDSLIGGFGNDTLYGRTGDDTLNGFDGTDTIYGGDGADGADGGAGDDLVDGGNNNDILSGGADNDDLYGRQGNDTLNGDAGTDDLFGGDGLDTLNGGLGNDALNGGGGDDTFVFVVGSGDDTISDFVAGGAEDTLDLSAYNGSGVTWTITQVGADTVFDFSNGDSITLLNVNSANLVVIDPWTYG